MQLKSPQPTIIKVTRLPSLNSMLSCCCFVWVCPWRTNTAQRIPDRCLLSIKVFLQPAAAKLCGRSNLNLVPWAVSESNAVFPHTPSSYPRVTLIRAGKRGRKKALLFLLHNVVYICQHCDCFNFCGVHPVCAWGRRHPTLLHYHHQQPSSRGAHISITHQLDLWQAVYPLVSRQTFCGSNVLTQVHSALSL